MFSENLLQHWNWLENNQWREKKPLQLHVKTMEQISNIYIWQHKNTDNLLERFIFFPIYQ